MVASTEIGNSQVVDPDYVDRRPHIGEWFNSITLSIVTAWCGISVAIPAVYTLNLYLFVMLIIAIFCYLYPVFNAWVHGDELPVAEYFRSRAGVLAGVICSVGFLAFATILTHVYAHRETLAKADQSRYLDVLTNQPDPAVLYPEVRDVAKHGNSDRFATQSIVSCVDNDCLNSGYNSAFSATLADCTDVECEGVPDSVQTIPNTKRVSKHKRSSGQRTRLKDVANKQHKRRHGLEKRREEQRIPRHDGVRFTPTDAPGKVQNIKPADPDTRIRGR